MKRAFTYGFGISLAITAVAAWILISPLFIDEVVDEQFPGVPTPEALAQMSDGKKATMAGEVLDTARGMPDKAMDDAKGDMMQAGEPLVLAAGAFRDADSIHKGSGDAGLYRLADGNHVLRLENLNVTNGPDLHVFLVRHPGPTSSADVTKDNYVDLGALKGNIGNQNYAIAPGTDVAGFSSVVVWCKAFGVLFSTAPLTAASS
ncbi:MAG: DM13 domain-containing protein [Proteobacteria bacterium]|nr:DM13 domain-containing protein [Pseudomonadota bacterium]